MKNARSNFITQIDKNEFNYIDSKNLSVAIKSITFENKFNTISDEYGNPSMILIQETQVNKAQARYEGIWDSIKNIDVRSGKDYYILPDDKQPFAEGKNFELRNFTDIKLFCSITNSLNESETLNNFIVHNIYLHDTNFETRKDFLNYLNNIYKTIEFDYFYRQKLDKSKLFKLDSKEYAIFFNKKKFNYGIYLSKAISDMLGFYQLDQLQYGKYDCLNQLLVSHFKYQYSNRDEILYFPEELETFSKYSFINDFLKRKYNNDTIYSKISPNDNDDYIKAKSKINIKKTFPEILGLRTNLSKPDIFKNCVYDTQTVFINVRDHKEGIQIFSDENPSFFETTLEKIANAEFELIDTNTGKVPNFSIGRPTFIHVMASNNHKIKPRFNVFLDSSDKISQDFFPHNNPFDFRIKLPERLEFNKDWEVSLKTMFMGNDLFNIYKNSCWMTIKIIKVARSDVDLSGVYNVKDLIFIDKTIKLEEGKYKNIEELCSYIQSLFFLESFQLKIDTRDNHIRIKCLENPDPLLKEYSITFSPYLSNILGIDISTLNENTVYFTSQKSFIATFKPNIFLLVPTNFIILCDIVSNSVFGSKSIQILKLVSENFDPFNEIMQFSFHQDEFVQLNIKEFSSIGIKIIDTTGNIIKSSQSYPTRCQIQFEKNISKI